MHGAEPIKYASNAEAGARRSRRTDSSRRSVAGRPWRLNAALFIVLHPCEIQPLRFPKRLIVKLIRQCQQQPANRIKDEPGEKKSARALDHRPRIYAMARGRVVLARKFPKSRGADDTILVFGYTLPAE